MAYTYRGKVRDLHEPWPDTEPTPDELCGTYTGYTRHRAKNEPACQPCKTANAANSKAAKQRWRARKKVDA